MASSDRERLVLDARTRLTLEGLSWLLAPGMRAALESDLLALYGIDPARATLSDVVRAGRFAKHYPGAVRGVLLQHRTPPRHEPAPVTSTPGPDGSLARLLYGDDVTYVPLDRMYDD